MTLVEVRDLVKHYAGERSWFGLGRAQAPVRAVDGVSFAIPPGRTLGLVGESGCGKTTIGRTILRLEEATSAEMDFEGTDLAKARGDQLRKLPTRIQLIFQDPYSSLSPRMTIRQIIAEPLNVYRRVPNR